MLEGFATREGSRDETISDIGSIRGSTNVADELTKQMSRAVLRTVLQIGQLHIHPDQIFVRSD